MKKWVLLCAMLFLLTACQVGGGSQIIIEWVDLIKWDGKHYEAVYETALADDSFIEKEIGEVHFKVADHVHKPSYQFKDGDASFHDKGTKLFAVKGQEDTIAVKDQMVINGYRLYMVRDEAPKKWRFEQIPLADVKRIEFYTFSMEEGNKKTASYTEQSDVEEILTILANSKLAPSFEPNLNSGDTIRYDVLLYTDEAIAFQYGIQFDGTIYFWFPSEKAILSNDIQQLISKD